MDKILMLRNEGYMGARRIYIDMQRRQAPELGLNEVCVCMASS